MDRTTITIGGEKPVRRIGFGALRLTGGPGDEACRAVLRRAVELGVTLIDTADAYYYGDNERLIADALHPYPDDLVIATKAGQSRPSAREWVPLGRPEYLRQQAELSLRRLRVECIDLFFLHRVDPRVPLADQIGALSQLREDGKVRHVGLSQVSVAQLEEARTVMPIAAVQNRYNLSDRTSQDVLDHCTRNGIAFLPWLPVAPATLTDAARQVADRHRVTPTQVALAWLLATSPMMLPIPGTASVDHLTDNVAAADLHLSEADLEALSLLASH